uniref:Uncharacterized protein n=1 Tax=Lygus hesperus TaxID=30085 RepID=A0A0A9YVH2_LYGHE
MTFVGTGIVSTCAFLKNSKWLLIGAIVVTVSSVYWFLMSVLSFIPSPALFNYLCIMDRCPPTHWIFEVPWRRAGTDAYQPHHLDESTTDTTTTDNTTTTSNTTTTDKTDGNQTTKIISDETSPIDLNSGATFPPNATPPLVAVDCSAATIDNAFLLKELHDLKPIEKMVKRKPSDLKDDAEDADTLMDNGLYDDLNQTDRARVLMSDNSSTESSTTSEATTTVPTTITTVSTTTASPTIEATVSINFETTAPPQSPQTDSSGQRQGDVEPNPISQQNINTDHNSPYPQVPAKVPEEIQKRRDKQWGVRTYLSSQEVIYTDDMYGENLTMSIICFVVFSKP